MPRHRLHSLLLIAFVAPLWVAGTLSAKPYAFTSSLRNNNSSLVNTANLTVLASIQVPFGLTGVEVITPDESTNDNGVIAAYGSKALPRIQIHELTLWEKVGSKFPESINPASDYIFDVQERWS